MAARRKTAPAAGQAYLPGLAPAWGPALPSGKRLSMAAGLQTCGLVSMALDAARHEKAKSRAVVAAEMSELTGEDITEHMLNACSAESKEGHRFPLQWAPPLCFLSGDYRLLAHSADLVGAVFLTGDDAMAAHAAAMETKAKALLAEADAIKKHLGGRK